MNGCSANRADNYSVSNSSLNRGDGARGRAAGARLHVRCGPFPPPAVPRRDRRVEGLERVPRRHPRLAADDDLRGFARLRSGPFAACEGRPRPGPRRMRPADDSHAFVEGIKFMWNQTASASVAPRVPPRMMICAAHDSPVESGERCRKPPLARGRFCTGQD